MTSLLTSSVRHALRWVGPLGAALAYCAGATLSILLTTSTHSIAVVWPSSGVLLAALLLAARPAWPRYVAAAALACLAANLGMGNAFAVSVGFTAANMAESVLAAALLRHGGRRPSFLDPDGLVRFCAAGVLGAAASATLATLTATATLPVALAPFGLSWFATDLLGILVIAPMVLIAAELRWSAWQDLDARQVAAAGALLGAVALTALGTFAQSAYPLLFLPLLPLLAAVVRLGPAGAVAGVWIIATVGAVATALESGPIHLVEGSPAARVLFLQAYLLAAFMAALPVAALLAARDALAAARDRLTAQLLERNRLLGMAEAAARVGHWRLDSAIQSVFWSPEVFRICGRAPDNPPSLGEAIGAYHPDDRAMVAATVQTALDEGAPFEFNARIVWPDGELRHVLARGEVDRDGSGAIAGVFGVFQDVSLQVAHEAALVRARESAEEAARLREQFVAVLGHELRNPLTAITAGLRLIEREPGGEHAATLLGMMELSTGRMKELIDNTLDLARTRHGDGLRLRFAWVPLAPVLEQVLAEVRASRPDARIDAEIDLTTPVRCDRDRIGQMMANLVSNAVAHGDPEQPVRVNAVARNGVLALSVANGGEPIPPPVLENLFEPFSRSAHPERMGLGLGLYIAAEIARAHRGRLDVTSTPAETRFTFRMPLGAGASTAVPRPHPAEGLALEAATGP